MKKFLTVVNYRLIIPSIKNIFLMKKFLTVANILLEQKMLVLKKAFMVLVLIKISNQLFNQLLHVDKVILLYMKIQLKLLYIYVILSRI